MKTGFYKFIGEEFYIYAFYDGSPKSIAGYNPKTGELSGFWSWNKFEYCKNQNQLLIQYKDQLNWLLCGDIQTELF